MSEKLELKFVKDAPVSSQNGEYFSFYHEYVAPALKDIVDNDVYTIGLFGKWGTGKSSIIEILKEKSKHPVYVFDTWKYQNDPLRRTFLLSFFKFICDKKLWKKGEELQQEFLDDLYYSTSTQTEDTINEQAVSGKGWLAWFPKIWKFVKHNFLFVGLLLFGTSWLLLQIGLSESNSFVKAVLIIPGLIAQSSSVAILLGWGIKKVFENLVDRLMKDLTKDAKTATIIKSREFLNSPELFEEKFKSILSRIEGKVVIVFDNVDRVQGKAAIDVLASIKTFFEPKEVANAVFIVPCDYDAISKQIAESYKEKPAEFLSKLFSVVLRTPEFIGADLEDYTRTLIKTTGTGHELLLNEDVIYVIKQAYGQNPRQIKQFINNLIAELYLVSQTEVWELVKKEVGYLAKVLVLKQEFPRAYERLKMRWATPEDIQVSDEDKDFAERLRAFMENTRLITTANATPFIYYKKPVRAKNVKKPEEIEQKLLENDYVSAQKLIEENSNFEAVVSLLLALFGQYQFLPEQLRSLVLGSIHVFSELGKHSVANEYHNEVAQVLSRELWKDYLSFPTQKIFSYLIDSQQLKAGLRRLLIERYISILSSEEIIKGGKREHKEILLATLESLAKYKKRLNTKDKSSISNAIKQNFSKDQQVLDIFKSDGDIKDFISDQTILDVINGITLDNYTFLMPIMVRYQSRIIELEMSNAVFQKFSDLVKEETAAASDFRPEKGKLFEVMTETFENLIDLPDHVNGSYADDLGTQLVTAAKHISQPDNSRSIISTLQFVDRVTSGAAYEAAIAARRQYLTHATPQSLKEFFDYEKNRGRSTEIIKEDLAHLLPIFRDKLEYREVIYEAADEEDKVQLLQDIVSNTPNLGLNTLESREQIPGRTQIVELMLTKLAQLSAADRVGGYNWIIKNLQDSDSVELKNKLIAQLDEMLMTDNNGVAKVGYDVYTAADFISLASRRDLAQRVLDWLRDSTHNLTHDNAYALKTVVFAANELSLADTPKRDLTHLLLQHLRPEYTKEILAIVLESLVELSPHYSAGEQSFEDVLESLKSWSDVDSKLMVIEELMKLKPANPRGKARGFWMQLSQIHVSE